MNSSSIRLPGQFIYKFTCPDAFVDLIKDYSNKNINWNNVERRIGPKNNGRSYIPEPECSLSLISELEKVHFWIEKCLNEVHEIVGWNKGLINKIKISQSWLNCSFPGELHHQHNHPLSLLSAILYIQGKGETTFYEKSIYSLPEIIDTRKGLKNLYLPINVTSPIGTLIVFSSQQLHSVNVNESSENRITLSINSWFNGIGDPKNLTYISPM
mgnify:CR=1 FL=1